MRAIYINKLRPVREKATRPLKGVTFDTMVLELVHKSFVYNRLSKELQKSKSIARAHKPSLLAFSSVQCSHIHGHWGEMSVHYT